MKSLFNRFIFYWAAATGACCLPGWLAAQNLIPDLPQNTQVTQTITIQKLPDEKADPEEKSSAPTAKEETDEELQEKINRYLQEYEQKQKEKEDAKEKSSGKKSSKKVTQPGKFVPFFPAGGTQTAQPEPEGGAPLASQRPAYPRANRRPVKRPGSSHSPNFGKPHTPVFRPMNPAPSVRPIMAPGSTSPVNPGSDPRLYRPPTGIKRPTRPAAGVQPNRSSHTPRAPRVPGKA